MQFSFACLRPRRITAILSSPKASLLSSARLRAPPRPDAVASDMSVKDEDEPPLKRATLEAHRRLLEQVSTLHPLSVACVQLADMLVAEVVDETLSQYFQMI